MPFAKGRVGRKSISMKDKIIKKFGLNNPIHWKQLENYLCIKEGYKKDNLIGHISIAFAKDDNIYYELRINEYNAEKWIIFKNKY